MTSWMEKREVRRTPSKEEEVEDDEQACLYAMLLSTLQVFPSILNAAIDLNLFEILSQGGAAGGGDTAYLSVPEIVSQLQTQPPELHTELDRMLRVLSSFSVLKSTTRINDDDGSVERLYSLSLAGKYFVKNKPENLAFFTNLNCHPTVSPTWLSIKEAVVDGGMIDLFQKVHGISMWKYLEKDAQLNHTFNMAMAGLSATIMKKYLQVYHGFEGVSKLVDVGGGIGQCLKTIISQYPHLKGVNFDLPQVIEHAPPYPGIEHVGGNMYESVPKGDAIMIKSTIHNWSDESCVTILRNCYKALPENGKVIIMEMIMPEEADSSDATKVVSMTDSTMFLLAGGKERTEKEFEKLCKDAGFSSSRVVCRTLSVFGVMEFYK